MSITSTHAPRFSMEEQVSFLERDRLYIQELGHEEQDLVQNMQLSLEILEISSPLQGDFLPTKLPSNEDKNDKAFPNTKKSCCRCTIL